MTVTHKQVALNFIDAMGRGDAEAAADCISEETITLAKGFGKFAGVRQRDTILATIAAFRQLMPSGMEPTIHSVIAENDRVVVEFVGNGMLVSGEPYGNEYCMVFTFRGGRIQQVNEYFCTLLADQKLWPLVSQMSL